MQQGRTLPCSYQITENAGAARVHGAELEIQGRVSGHLTLGAGVGYTKAALAVDAPSLDGVSGQQLENVPRWNGNASARYDFSAAPGYDGFVRADAQYVGESFPDFDRLDPATFQRAYAIADLRAGVKHERWETDVFVDNIADRVALLSRFSTDNYDAPNRTRMFVNRPRTVGVSVERRF